MVASPLAVDVGPTSRPSPVGPSEVRLETSSGSDGARVARLVAADAATRAGFDDEEADDLRLAVDELFYAAASSSDAALVVRFVTSEGTVTVWGCTTPSPAWMRSVPLPPELSWLAHQIVEAVADGYRFERDGSSVRFWLVKHRSIG